MSMSAAERFALETKHHEMNGILNRGEVGR